MIHLKKNPSPVLEKKLTLRLLTDGGSSSVDLSGSILLPQMLLGKKAPILLIKAYLNYFNHLFGVFIKNESLETSRV